MKQLVCITMVFAFATSAARVESQPALSAEGGTSAIEHTVNAYGSALTALAQDQYRAHQASKQTWVLVVRKTVNSDRFEKFTDGIHTVAIVPSHPLMFEGIQLYCDAYNALVTKGTDELSLKGAREQALGILRLQKRFLNRDFCELHEIDRRIQAAEESQAGKNLEANEAYLKSRSLDYLQLPFRAIEQSTAKKVANLLELQVQ